jgi:cytochrome c oxidase subunit 2
MRVHAAPFDGSPHQRHDVNGAGPRLLTAAFALASAAFCASCGGPQNILAPGGPAARRLADAGWLVLITFSVVTLVMWGLIGWLALRRKGTLAEHAPWDAGGGMRWIAVGGMTIPIVVLGVIFVVTLQTMAAFPMGDNEMNAPPPLLRIIGHQWWWELQYLDPDGPQVVVTANEIHIPAGRPVDIELQSIDVIHSFWVPELHGKVDLIPGKVNRIRVQADGPQTFRGECAEFCGPQHSKMILLVRADAPRDFEAWVARESAAAQMPMTPEAVHGEQLFLSKACVLCHTVRGTGAHGMVGPDLTHVGRRRRIAANAFDNNTANLSAWVTHAQTLKPYAKMPNLSVFTGEELRDVVAYLQGLD